MMYRRKAVAGIAVLVAAGFAMTGCNKSGDSSSSATSTPAASSSATAEAALAPKPALLAALADLASTGYNLTLSSSDGSETGTGSIDPATKSASLTDKASVSGINMSISLIHVDTNLWVKADLGAMNAQFGLDPAKWMQVDQSKLTGADAKKFELATGDGLGIAGLLSSINDVARTDATHITGTVDLSAATGISAPDSDDLTKAGSAASSVPFTATLDDQGRLAEIKIDASGAAKDLEMDFTFSDYGSPTAVTAPDPSTVVPAPAAAYQFLNAA